jgi:hypothetical protein
MVRICIKIAAILLTFTHFADAQELFRGRKYGITMTAPAFSFLSTNDSNLRNSGANLGYGVNVHLEFPVTSYISWISGIGFRGNAGGRLRHEFGGNLLPNARLSNPLLNSGTKPMADGTSIRYKLNTLEVPFGLRFYTGYKNSRQFFAELPVVQVGFRLNAKGDIQSGNIETKGENITTETRFMYVGVGGALGMQYDLGAVQFEVALTGQYWVTDMTRNSGIRVIGEPGGQIISQNIMSSDRPVILGLRFGIFF